MARNRNTQQKYGITKGGYIFGVFLFVLVIFFETVFVNYLYDELTDVDNIQIGHVKITGNLKYSTKEDIEQYFRDNPNSYNMMTMDLIETRAYMETMPWIYHASMRKRLPDILTIHVVEHTPLAYYNDGVLVSDWSIIHPENTNNALNLPRMNGPEKLARTVYEMYKVIDGYIQQYGYRVQELNLSDSYIWNFKLNNGLLLILGRENTIDLGNDQNNVFFLRLSNFIKAYPYIQDKDNIEYIDLRYDTGVAVKWVERKGQ
ncbi:MAG: cell division protein FtsQ/DivIB [Ruminobacter sp.]|nr:cell division protein FtsQ/DivIB [Ruminobacter sp.]MBR1924278.1 cell division protein FtsQ/DivIB [Ruminobacter sp.]